MRALEGSFLGSTYMFMFEFAILFLVLNIEKLSIHDVKLCVDGNLGIGDIGIKVAFSVPSTHCVGYDE